MRLEQTDPSSFISGFAFGTISVTGQLTVTVALISNTTSRSRYAHKYHCITSIIHVIRVHVDYSGQPSQPCALFAKNLLSYFCFATTPDFQSILISLHDVRRCERDASGSPRLLSSLMHVTCEGKEYVAAGCRAADNRPTDAQSYLQRDVCAVDVLIWRFHDMIRGTA